MSKKTFIVRVQIPNGIVGEYTRLKNALVKIGFTKTIVGDNRVRYVLPNGNYLCESDRGITEIRDIVSNIAIQVKRGCQVLVTESSSNAWVNLPPA